MKKATVLILMTAIIVRPACGSEIRTVVPLTIDDAIAGALIHDLHLRSVRQDWAFDLHRMKLSRRNLFPTISIGYSAMDSVRYEASDSFTRRVSAGLEQLVFSAGRRRNARKLQPKHIELARLSVDDTEAQVRRTVIETFAELLEANESISLLRRLLESTRRQRSITAEQYQMGSITELRLIEVDLAMHSIELDLLHAQTRFDRLTARLSRAVKLPLDSIVEPSGSINSGYRGSIELDRTDELIVALRRGNLQLHRARLDTAIAMQQKRNAYRSWMPDLRVRAETHAAGDRFPLTEPGFTVTATLSFAAALMPGEMTATVGSATRTERSRGVSATARPGDNVEEVLTRRIATFAYDRAVEQLEMLEQALIDRVGELVAEIRLIRRRLDLLHIRVEMERRAADIDAERLRLGEITHGQFVESQISVSRTEMEINRQVVALVTAEISLQHELGIPFTAADRFINTGCAR